jgi:hypothetical protein
MVRSKVRLVLARLSEFELASCARVLDATRSEVRHPPGRASQPIQSTHGLRAMSGKLPGDMS